MRVVLLDPHRGSNVGAACRAIRNMGAGRLAVVGGSFDEDEARRTAVHAAGVFDARHRAGSFDEAVAGCRLVVGTTSRTVPWKIPVAPIGEVLAQARTRGLDAADIALVFGPEDRGLSNEELACCHRLAFVPTAGDYASLNLAQAVVVCLYEWLRSSDPPQAPDARTEAVAAAEASSLASAMTDLEAVLREIGFLEGDQAERVMASIASIFLRSGLDEREIRIVRGIVRQIRWAASPARHRNPA